jgi:LytR cell envelope-related transcriptional attenuator
MSKTPTSGDVARGAGFAAAKGVLLIGLAVVIGIVLLQQVDNDSKRPVGATTPGTKSQTKATTTVPSVASSTTTVPSTPPKSPAQLRVIVLNGGGPAGTAARMNTSLKGKQYTNQADANNWSGHKQQGTTVLCKAGLERETLLLVAAVDQQATTKPFPTPAPPYTDGPPPVDCVVVVGS